MSSKLLICYDDIRYLRDQTTELDRPMRTMDRWHRICLILISLEVFTNTNLSIKKSKDLSYGRTTTTPNQAPELAPKLLMCPAHLPPSTLSAIAVVWSDVFLML